MVRIYKTISGDTWDVISLRVYKTDKLAHKIMDANKKYINIVFFSAGIELVIPELESKENLELPPWRQ